MCFILSVMTKISFLNAWTLYSLFLIFFLSVSGADSDHLSLLCLIGLISELVLLDSCKLLNLCFIYMVPSVWTLYPAS